MKCSDLQLNLSLYTDGMLSERDSTAASDHLNICPLCRQACSDIREMRAALGRMRRPEIPLAFKSTLKDSVRVQRIKDADSWVTIPRDVREWLQMRLMPYSVGVAASVIIGFAFLTMLFAARGDDSSMLFAANTNLETRAEISPREYAQSRLGFASESPSINPQGALVALTRSLVRGGMTDDEVVVVADVFGNGLAQIAEVVEPSRDWRAVMELQKALESDPAYAAFVPAKMENRPDSVRVVLKFQSVNVRTGN